MTVLRAGSATDVGRTRSVNQDSVLTAPNLFVVADGMGGHAGGEVASSTAIAALDQAQDRVGSDEQLIEAIRVANEAVYRASVENSSLAGMGTTVVAACLVSKNGADVLTIANVGDSRGYLLHDGVLTQITRDHSLAAEMVRNGDISEEEAATHPQRHVITRALGIEGTVEVDVFSVVLAEGDRVLLCSDGLTNEVDTEELTRALGAGDDPHAVATDLVRRDATFAKLGLSDADVDTPAKVADVLAAHGQLLQRPVIVAGGRAIIGRPKDRVAPFLEAARG